MAVEPLIERIDKIAANDKLSHAYLITGFDFEAALEVANHLAGIFLNTDIHEGSPDLLTIGAEKQNIKIDTIRQTLEVFSHKSITGVGKVLQIFNSQNLNIASFNALLKFIEEPAGQQMIILTVPVVNMLPETIISRVQILHTNDSKHNKELSVEQREILENTQWYQRSNQAIESWLKYLFDGDVQAFAEIQLKFLPLIHEQEFSFDSVFYDLVVNHFNQLFKDTKDTRMIQSLSIILDTENLNKINISFQNQFEYMTSKILEIYRD